MAVLCASGYEETVSTELGSPGYEETARGRLACTRVKRSRGSSAHQGTRKRHMAGLSAPGFALSGGSAGSKIRFSTRFRSVKKTISNRIVFDQFWARHGVPPFGLISVTRVRRNGTLLFLVHHPCFCEGVQQALCEPLSLHTIRFNAPQLLKHS